jgi:hypothetical protein
LSFRKLSSSQTLPYFDGGRESEIRNKETQMDAVKLETGNYFLGRGDQVLINNGALVDVLVKEASTVIGKFSAISPITLNNVSIDDTGNIIIADPKFRAAVETALNSPSGASANGVGAVCVNIKACVAE